MYCKKAFMNGLFFLFLWISCCALYFYQIIKQPYFSIIKFILISIFFGINSFIFSKKKPIYAWILPSIFILLSITLNATHHSLHPSLIVFYGGILLTTFFGFLLNKQKKRN